MLFFVGPPEKMSFAETARALSDYRVYLNSVRTKLPARVFEFATADWHYNFEDHRCPHDSWVESLSIMERSSGARAERRWIDIEVKLLGAYHDGHIYLAYEGVQSYSLTTPSDFVMPPLGVGHGDWLIDEVRLADSGLVVHEVAFSRGSRWSIECKDLLYHWKPIS